MSAEGRSDPQMEIGHVLAMDVVGYSKLLIREQSELLRRLNEIVRNTAQVCAADAQGKLIRLPTGNGMALVFFGDPKAPIECATEIAIALKQEPEIALRMGIHSGPINRVLDVNERANAAGAGILRPKEILAHHDPALGYNIGDLRFYLGWAQEVAGDHAAAQESWRQARSELEPLLKEQPGNYLLISTLALSDMGLGDKAAALTLAESAMAGNPIEKDAVIGARPLEIFARVAAQTGEPDRAIAAIQKLLSIPYSGPMTRQLPLTPALLRLDPMFDPLRNDPRFQKLAASPAPKDKQ